MHRGPCISVYRFHAWNLRSCQPEKHWKASWMRYRSLGVFRLPKFILFSLPEIGTYIEISSRYIEMSHWSQGKSPIVAVDSIGLQPKTGPCRIGKYQIPRNQLSPGFSQEASKLLAARSCHCQVSKQSEQEMKRWSCRDATCIGCSGKQLGSCGKELWSESLRIARLTFVPSAVETKSNIITTIIIISSSNRLI